MMFDQIAVQNMWAAGHVDDAHYPGFALLGALRIVTPLARASMRKEMTETVRRLQAELAYAGTA